MSENTSILEDLVQQIVISAHMVKNCLAQKVVVSLKFPVKLHL